MSELDDIGDDDGDSIDWNEAIETLNAVETARATQQPTQSTSTATATTSIFKRRASTAVDPATIADSPTDEDILFLYDLIDTSQYILVNDDGEDIEDLVMKQSLKPAARTLFEQFRQRRGFSVTDLTAPSGWCEVQYAYGLLGRRDAKPEHRPEKIVTAAGNEIKINKRISVVRDKVLEKGRQVHAVLEREVHPEQIRVRTDTKADRWGLRILNQIVSLTTLRDAGKAREIPVFGFFDDDFVMGVIDEVEKRPLPTIEVKQQGSKQQSSEPEGNTVKITDFFKRTTPVVHKPTHGYYLVDSKTRNKPDLPKMEYTVSSQYQLMLYRYLFDKHATDSIDWPRFWKYTKLSPEDKLSPSFLEQTKAICIGSNLEDMLDLTTIGEMSEYLRATHLEIGELQETLELVYRWRGGSDGGTKRFKRRSLKKKENEGSDSVAITVADDAGDADLQAAIAASLKDQAGTAEKPISIDEDAQGQAKAAAAAAAAAAVADDSGMFVDAPLPPRASRSPSPKHGRFSLARELQNMRSPSNPTPREVSSTPPKKSPTLVKATSPPVAHEVPVTLPKSPSPVKATGPSAAVQNVSTTPTKSPPPTKAASPTSSPLDVREIAIKAELVSKQVEGSVIGTKKFQYNEEEMMKYVRNNLSFWKGREPQGVSLNETVKCRSCEFQDGCEWLAMKAEEHLVRAREKRALQEANTKTRIVL